MKHFLLTWYGLTDLRAALGLEATDGPILSALKTGNFTDVVILAYTNPGKEQNAFDDVLRAKWEKWRSGDLETRLKFPRDQAQHFVDVLSNTPKGHSIFMDWLNSELNSAALACNLQILPRELKKLNDSRGIHNAAAGALKRALEDDSEKTITMFISPGTPVMAYTWALIARVNPEHDIRVIASSEPRKPPELIDLPKDLLMPVVVAPNRAKPSKFDVVVHLLGRERMPIYFGMLQFEAKEHVFITTQEYHNAATVLSRLLPPGCNVTTVIIQNAFRPADTRMAIEKEVNRFPLSTKIAVNLTGGTKLMFSGALATCWERRLEPFYFEINHHNVIFIRDGSTVPFIGAKSVSHFFTVNGFDIVTNGHRGDNPSRDARLEVTRKLWKARHRLGDLYRTKEFRNYKIHRGTKRNPSFSYTWGKSQASFTATGRSTLSLDGEEISIQDCNDFGEYLGGGWLEEYVFSLLQPLAEKGLIYDLRIGIELDYAGRPRRPEDAPNGEFDCAFTDGKRLWLVECKAGAVKQEHIQKLENNLKTYGGISARGLLVSSFPIGVALVRRVSSSTSIRTIQPQQLSSEILENTICS